IPKTNSGRELVEKVAARRRGIFFVMDITLLIRRLCDEARQFRGFTEATIRRYRTVLELFAKQANVREIESVNESCVRNWFFQGRTERRWSAQTFRTYHKTLKVFFRWCRKNGQLQAEPLTDIALPKADRRLPPRLSRAEATLLLEVTDNHPWPDAFVRHRNHGIVATFLFAGLLNSE